MQWLEAARARLRLLLAPRAAESRMEEEIRFHIEMETERLVAEEGLDEGEARRRALVAFGGVEKVKEELRDGRGLAWLAGMSLDLKLGARMLAKTPGLTVVATLALAVAIGGGAGYLELVNDLFSPRLPFADGGRIVGIHNVDAASGGPDDRVLHDFAAWRRTLRSVEELGAFRALERNLITADGRAEPVRGVEISASAFRVTRVPPALGRPLVAGDEDPAAPPVVVLGHALWRARFGGDPAVVGRTVRLGSTPHTVVGVMPPGFAFPVNHALWVPLRTDGVAFRRGEGPAVKVFGRLAPGVGLAEAQAELAALGSRLAAEAPGGPPLRPRVRPYVPSLVFSARDGRLQMAVLRSLNLFFVGLLAVCAANVATLVFARTAARQGEITVRHALGASRRRIVAQLCAEALVLASLGAALGVGAAAAVTRGAKRTFEAAQGTPAPFWWDERLSAATLLYAAVLTLAAAAMVGVVPALKATGPRMQGRLKEAAGGYSAMTFGRLWTGVIVAQVALTAAFLLVTAAVGWNVGRSRPAEPPFAPGAYLTARLEMDGDASPGAFTEAAEAELRTRFQARREALARRLEAEPGVAAVTFASALPGMAHPGLPVEVGGLPSRPDVETWVRTAAVEPGFFEAFDAPLVAGRGFAAGDGAPGRGVAVVDQAFARLVLGERDPVGTRVRRAATADGEAAGPWLEIVGVVRDLGGALEKTAEDAVLYRLAAPGEGPVHLAVRARGDASALAPRLRPLAAAVDPALRLHDVAPLEEVGRADAVALGFLLGAIAVVGLVVLLLASAGIYALMSFTVARRTREIGIRAALGAAPRRVVTGIFSRAFRQLGVGVVAGCLPGSVLVVRGLPEVVSGVGLAMGAAAVAAVAAFLLGVGLLAALGPAARALRIEPTEALRAGG